MFTAALFTTVKTWNRTSLVAEWIRSHLPMQGTQVPSLVQEDSMCCAVTKLMHHNYRGHTLEPTCCNY